MNTEQLKAGPASESGNGVILDIRKRSGKWTVRFMSEARTSPQPLWFHVECSGAPGDTVRFVWENASGCLGLGNPANLGHVRPVVRLDDGPWRRVGGVTVGRLRHGAHAVCFEAACGEVRTGVAFCYPYGPEDLDATLAEVGRTWRRSILGLTANGRPLLRLEAPAQGRSRKGPAIYLVARQHAGETPGSWVLDGLLRAVAGDRATGLLRRVTWLAVPFMDLDGVVAGNYGKDSQPVDFNRSWNPVTMRPEVLAVQADLARFASTSERRLVLDLHAPAGGERQLYQFISHPGRPPEQRAAQCSHLSALSRQFPGMTSDALSHENGYQASKQARWDGNHTICNWTWDHLNGTPGVTIETTYLSLGDGPYLEPKDYRELGWKVARAAADWLLSRS